MERHIHEEKTRVQFFGWSEGYNVIITVSRVDSFGVLTRYH